MEGIGTALRRTFILVVFAVGIGAMISWRRSQAPTPTPAEPPQWPDWPERADERTAPTASTPALSWVSANDDGSTPDSHPVKAKESSGIFHVPGGRFYDRTKADRCYPTAAAAEADGYRQSKT